MIAVVDETTPEVSGGILYTVVSAVLISDESAARDALAQVVGDRKRPFHWNTEGPQAREAMRHCMESIGVVGRAVVISCGRKTQEHARAIALQDTLRHLVDEGCSTLLIESRSAADDGRDRATILEHLRTCGGAGQIAYDWRTKQEPLIWIADAVGGAVREHLIGDDPVWYERIVQVTDLHIEYRTL